MALRDIDVDLIERKLNIRYSIQWPRPKDGVAWAIKPVKTKTRRETPYPGTLHDSLREQVSLSLGLPVDADLETIVMAQDAKRERKYADLDARSEKLGKARDIEGDEGLLFVDAVTGLPPTKERFNDRWHTLQEASGQFGKAWPRRLPYLNARHHTVTWWREHLLDPNTGYQVPWEDIAGWLGHDVATCLNRYVRQGEDAIKRARHLLDGL